MLRNLKMIVAYEGTRYAGFQRQKNAQTIQEILETGLSRLTQETIIITGAARTDSGVHAKGQVINFLTNSNIPNEHLQKGLNSILPDDILIVSTTEVPHEFHARYSTTAKTYVYRIHNHELRPLFNRNFTYHYKYPLNLETMRSAAGMITGEKDFRSFQAAGSVIKTTVRHIHYCIVKQIGFEICIEINANGFLYHMVRNIVGTLLLVGNGRLSVEQFQEILEIKDRKNAGPTAPARGLCLEEVFY